MSRDKNPHGEKEKNLEQRLGIYNGQTVAKRYIRIIFIIETV